MSAPAVRTAIIHSWVDMLTPAFKQYLEDQSYFELRESSHGVIGLWRFVYTTGICVGLDQCGYRYRYCYPSLLSAMTALKDWATAGYQDEPKGYIKRKGLGGDKSGEQCNSQA